MPDPYKAPEQMPKVLQGIISDHPRFSNDGKVGHTSRIVGLTAEGKVRTSSGSEYELGEPSAEYEKQFPDAKQRFLESIEKV